MPESSAGAPCGADVVHACVHALSVPVILCTESEGATRAALCAACYVRARGEVGEPLELVPLCAACVERLPRVPKRVARTAQRAGRLTADVRGLWDDLVNG